MIALVGAVMRLIVNVFFFEGRTWPRRIAAAAVFAAFILLPGHLLKYWHAERVTIEVVGTGAFLTACWVARYVAGARGVPAPSVLGVSFIGLVVGGLCGYAAAAAYRLGSSAAVMSIEGGATVGMIICVVAYTVVGLLRDYRDASGRFSKRMMLMARPSIVDRSPATSRRINER